MTVAAHGLTRPRWLGVLLCVFLWLGIPAAQAETPVLWQEDAQRFRVGLKIFPACLGAVESLADALAPDGSLQVLVVYEGSDETARQALSSLETIDRIRGYPLRLRILSASALDEETETRAGGIFVASVGLNPKRLRIWSERGRVLVFSPFAGDVEAGAVAGLHVADRILPAVNTAQAQRARIRFKAFFLKVAWQHD
jgi:hypothetical protein